MPCHGQRPVRSYKWMLASFVHANMDAPAGYDVLGNICIQVYKRVTLGKREEEYRLVATFDAEPVGAKMTKLFLRG